MRIVRGACLAILVLALPAARGAVEATWGLDVLRPILANERNRVLPFGDCTLEGFAPDSQTEHRVPSLRRTGFPARILARAPGAGAYYTGIVLYDAAGAESVAISIGGEVRGVAVAGFDDNRERLFFLTEPYKFQGGETIEFRALGSQGAYRVEYIVLLAERPAARQKINAVRELAVDAFGDAAVITWITAWPVVSTVEWGLDGGSVRESAPMRNHRAVLRGLREGREYRYRIVAADASTDWKTFVVKPPVTAPGSAEKGRVPLRVAAFTREFPATAGVPFHKGVLGSDRNLRLVGPGGAEVPLQARALAAWDDGSVKWALLDFHASAPHCTLEYGRDVARAKAPDAVRVNQDAVRIEVSTGPLRFIVNKQRFGLIESAWYREERLISPQRPAAFYLTAPDGTVYSSLAEPADVVVEESGPLRAVIKVTGDHRAADGGSRFAYVVRIHAYAGQPFLRIEYTLGNDVNATEFASLRTLTLRVPLENPADAVKPSVIRAHSDLDRLDGWAEWGGRVTLAVRDFWQNYPKDLVVTDDGFELGICPPLRPDEYSNAKGLVDEHRLFYYLRDGLYTFHQGMTKTHDIWLDFGGTPSPLRTQTAPLFVLAPPEWYGESGALGELAAPKPSGIVAQYDAAFARSFEEYMANRQYNHEYGMLNFGDWWGERVINWGNTEYDTAHAFFLQFLRTGNPDYLRTAQQAEWHNRDVDSIHYSPVPARIGGVYYHSVGHTGRWYPSSPVPGKGINVGDTVVDHTFIEGRLDNWFLTGDRRSFESARETADRYCGTYTRNYDFEVVRQPGWHLILSMAMYNATGDRYYLNAAKIIVERVLERQREDGAWELLDFRPCPGSPPNSGQQTFMVGILLSGLKQYHEVTGDPRVRDAIVRGVRFTIEHAWSDEGRGLRNTPCLDIQPGYGSAFLAFEGFAYAHRLTGDPRIREVLLRGTGPAVEHMSGMGKSFTQYTRGTPHFIGYVDGLKP